MARVRRAQAGFTMIEMLVTIALIGILAAIAIPMFSESKRSASSRSEVNEFFTEFRIRQDQWFAENGSYQATGASEAAVFPAVPAAGGQALGARPASWVLLKIRPPDVDNIRCAYVVITGTRTTGSVGAQGTAMGFVAPPKHWYYVLARCDADGDASIDAYFMTTSESSDIKSSNDDH